jgi:hypothetical protein
MSAGRINEVRRARRFFPTQVSATSMALLLAVAVGCVAPEKLSDDDEVEDDDGSRVEVDAGTSFGQDVNGSEVAEAPEPSPWQSEGSGVTPGPEPGWSSRHGEPPPTVAPADCSQARTQASTLWWRRR